MVFLAREMRSSSLQMITAGLASMIRVFILY